MSKEFNEALGNFINDFASGGAIRHLSDLGCTVDEIVAKLDYPTPKERVAEVVFKYYIDMGKVCLTKPEAAVEKVSFIKEYGQFGKTTMRKVVEKVLIDADEYYACDYGKLIYRKEKISDISDLPKRMQAHILSLPWPVQTVWVRKDLWN